MKKDVIFDNFLETEEDLKNQELKNVKNKKKAIQERTGLIERIDKILVTNDGRQLLRERY
jgi:hypothetical protein